MLQKLVRTFSKKISLEDIEQSYRKLLSDIEKCKTLAEYTHTRLLQREDLEYLEQSLNSIIIEISLLEEATSSHATLSQLDTYKRSLGIKQKRYDLALKLNKIIDEYEAQHNSSEQDLISPALKEASSELSLKSGHFGMLGFKEKHTSDFSQWRQFIKSLSRELEELEALDSYLTGERSHITLLDLQNQLEQYEIRLSSQLTLLEDIVSELKISNINDPENLSRWNLDQEI